MQWSFSLRQQVDPDYARKMSTIEGSFGFFLHSFLAVFLLPPFRICIMISEGLHLHCEYILSYKQNCFCPSKFWCYSAWGRQFTQWIVFILCSLSILAMFFVLRDLFKIQLKALHTHTGVYYCGSLNLCSGWRWVMGANLVRSPDL